MNRAKKHCLLCNEEFTGEGQVCQPCITWEAFVLALAKHLEFEGLEDIPLRPKSMSALRKWSKQRTLA